jgi:hypothetical protein
MKIKNLDTLLSELKERETEEKSLGIFSIDQAKETIKTNWFQN